MSLSFVASTDIQHSQSHFIRILMTFRFFGATRWIPLLPRVENHLPHLSFVEGTVTLGGFAEVDNSINQTCSLAHTTENILSFHYG